MNKFENYLIRRIDGQKKSLKDFSSFPSFVEIETVNACNARCPMCVLLMTGKEIIQ